MIWLEMKIQSGLNDHYMNYMVLHYKEHEAKLLDDVSGDSMSLQNVENIIVKPKSGVQIHSFFGPGDHGHQK